MVNNRPRWEMRITHEPTGEQVIVNSFNYRNQHQAREAAIGLLAARVKAKKEGLFQFRRKVGSD